MENSALRQSLGVAQARLDGTLGLLQDHVAIYDVNWRFVYVNEAAAKVLGTPRDELMGKCIWSIFPEAVGNQYYRQLHEARETGIAIRSEHYYQPTGTWFLNYIYPAQENVVVFSTDITETKRQVDQLRASQQALTLAMRGGKMGYWTRDMITNEVYWSPELEELFGLKPGEFKGSEKDFFAFMHPEDIPIMSGAVGECLKTGRDYSVEFRFIRADGSVGWMDGRGGATFDDEGSPVRLDGLGIDITDRKAAASALHESERQFRLLSEAMPAIAWTATPDGRLDYINRRCYDYSGIDPATPAASIRGVILHPDDQEFAQASYLAAIESGNPWQEEVRLRNGAGEYRWHLSRQRPVKDDYGTILRWIGTSTDIHDQKEAESELEKRVQERTRELLAANRELEGFTYSVSHDLRAPLRAISATSMILLQDASGKLSEDECKMLERQAHNAKRLGVLIDELLKLSRIGRQEFKRVDFDFSRMAAEVAAEIGLNEIAIEPNLTVNADPKLIRFVLANLLENAMKFSPDRKEVSVGTASGALFVRDRGIGFDMKYVEKVFQPFERLVPESEFPGTGIGLANAQRIIARHGGHIWAESEQGQGSTFYFTLQ